MIVSMARKSKELKFEQNLGILEKLDIYGSYFSNPNSVFVVDSENDVYQEKNDQFDILSQLYSDLWKYFTGKDTVGIFDLIKDLIDASLANKAKSFEIINFIDNTITDIKNELHNKPH